MSSSENQQHWIFFRNLDFPYRKYEDSHSQAFSMELLHFVEQDKSFSFEVFAPIYDKLFWSQFKCLKTLNGR